MGAVSVTSRENLLKALPPKPMSDGLIKRFFDNDDPAIPVTCKETIFINLGTLVDYA